MLLEYGIKNYFSFKDWTTVSFRLDANCPEEISQGRAYTTVMGVKGANASGKTHLLKAVSFLTNFISYSFQHEPGEELFFEPFYENKKKPAEFYIEFKIADVLYRYELVATTKQVIRETLFRTQKKRLKILERQGNEITLATKEFADFKKIKLRDNASFISTANQYELNGTQDVYKFFRCILTNVSYAGMKQLWGQTIEGVSKLLHEQPELFSFVKEVIKRCDTGISDIKILKNSRTETEEFFPMFVHQVGKKTHSIPAEWESSGTKALFITAPGIMLILKAGGVLVVDEFDQNLHPDVLKFLVDLFLDTEINQNNAQLIFSTHDSEILNLLGRYRTYIVNKEDNESYAFRLDEVPGDILRNDRPISPVYKSGKIGGVPRIE